ncbi:MAG: hypothetical protein WCX64_01920 [Candidatus Micrarchaeia archaeon]
MTKGAKDFLSIPFNRNLLIALAVIGFFLLAFEQAPASGLAAEGNGTSAGNLTVHFFFLPTCPHCAEQKLFNAELMREYPQVAWIQHDISKTAEAQAMSQMMKDHGMDGDNLRVPMTFIGNNYLLGYESKATTGVQLSAMLADYVSKNPQAANNTAAADSSKFTFDMPFLGKTDLRGMSLPALSVILGLVDGFNPCAMWVLAYLIALVMELNDRRRMWLIVGTFLFASGALYFLFMTAWLNLFLLVGFLRPVVIIIGLIALGSGTLAVREYFQTRGRPVCKVGNEESKSKQANRMQEIITSPLTISTLLAIVGLAFAVNAVEFVCSAGIPAVFTQILALSNLNGVEYYGYILLYDVFYMLDDIIIFCVAAFAISSTDFTQRYAGFSKIVGGGILFILGFLMLFAPGLLR